MFTANTLPRVFRILFRWNILLNNYTEDTITVPFSDYVDGNLLFSWLPCYPLHGSKIEDQVIRLPQGWRLADLFRSLPGKAMTIYYYQDDPTPVQPIRLWQLGGTHNNDCEWDRMCRFGGFFGSIYTCSKVTFEKALVKQDRGESLYLVIIRSMQHQKSIY